MNNFHLTILKQVHIIKTKIDGYVGPYETMQSYKLADYPRNCLREGAIDEPKN